MNINDKVLLYKIHNKYIVLSIILNYFSILRYVLNINTMYKLCYMLYTIVLFISYLQSLSIL